MNNRVVFVTCVSLIIVMTTYAWFQQKAAAKASEFAQDTAFALREAEAKLAKVEEIASASQKEIALLKMELEKCGKKK